MRSVDEATLERMAAAAYTRWMDNKDYRAPMGEWENLGAWPQVNWIQIVTAALEELALAETTA